MATYVLPNDRFTDEQRDSYYLNSNEDDLREFMAYVQDKRPDVFDEAIRATGRTYRLDAIHATTNGQTR